MNDMSVVQQFVTTTLVEVLFKVLAAMAFWFVGRWLISKVVALMLAAMGRNHVDTTLAATAAIAGAIAAFFWPIVIGFFFVRRRKNKRDDEIYRVWVRLDNGVMRSLDFHRVDDLRVGDRVRYEGGQLYRY